ncbi:MAG: hypothetical protein R3322_09235 [Kiloniellales bacterium]|nr:hypothetical protein [Kiloniellales bacterium]
MTRFAVTWMFVVTCAALAVFYVSQTVERLERELAVEQRTILQHQEAIHVLEAEWSYLNRPERISLLAERFLALAPLSADHVVSLNDLPQRPEPGDTDQVPGLPQANGDPLAVHASLASMRSGE